jgi:hypothetical protein
VIVQAQPDLFSGQDSKSIRRACAGFADYHVGYFGEGRTVLCPGDQFLYFGFRPAKECFDSAVSPIAYPAMKAETRGSFIHRLSVTDSLYTAMDTQMPGYHVRLT